MSEDGPTGQAGEFFALAGALRAFRAGPLGGHPSDRALAKAADVSATTIGEWLRGSRFPQDVGKILTVVRMVRDAAASRGITSLAGGPAGLLEEACWRQAWRAEAERRAGVVSSAVQRARAARALAPPPAGRPLAEVSDPFALEVHRPVQPEDAPAGLPVLPAYVPREHDQELGQVVRAAAGGRSGIAVLVGGSSTGKTRACWEALAPAAGPGPGVAAVASDRPDPPRCRAARAAGHRAADRGVAERGPVLPRRRRGRAGRAGRRRAAGAAARPGPGPGAGAGHAVARSSGTP